LPKLAAARARTRAGTRAGTREDTNIIWITLDHEGSHKRKNDV